MIRCNNCGTINPDTVTNCQNCNALLPTPVGKGENGGSSRTGAQDAPALPAWLESLRAGDRPNVEPKSFSLEDMHEEGIVPSWMQPNRLQDERNSNQYPAMRPAASPAPNTDENYAQARNISANSLIDANALPSWMQPEKPQMPQQNISASSLVQPEFMPDWMKTMQPSSSAPQQQPPAQQPPLSPQGFSANQLIDQQSLPNWMLQEGTQLFTPPAQAPSNDVHQAGNLSTGQSGFSASSLLDMNALPSWMRETGNGSQEQRGPQPQAWQPSPQQRGYEQPQAWQIPQQHQQPSTPASSASGQSGAGTLSMGSLIDMNALPEWLRSAVDSPQSQQGQQGPNTSPNYTIPPRGDNVRVPSRPRTESGMNEDSEVAANVFSSMLGVASNAPQYPPQAPQQPQQTGYSAYQDGQPMSNTALTPPAMQNSQAYNPQGHNPQAYSPQGYNPQAYGTGQLGQQNPGQQNYGYPMQPGQGNYYTGMGQQNQPLQQSEKPAKKVGLFEAIRNFFFRQ